MMLSVIPMITKKSMEYTQSGMKSELNVSQQKNLKYHTEHTQSRLKYTLKLLHLK